MVSVCLLRALRRRLIRAFQMRGPLTSRSLRPSSVRRARFRCALRALIRIVNARFGRQLDTGRTLTVTAVLPAGVVAVDPVEVPPVVPPVVSPAGVPPPGLPPPSAAGHPPGAATIAQASEASSTPSPSKSPMAGDAASGRRD